jgi:DNA-binding NtrC family response regulator
MKGDTVAKEFRSANPLGRAIFMTGYTDSIGFRESLQREGATILQKPFALQDLVGAIRKVLDQSKIGT